MTQEPSTILNKLSALLEAEKQLLLSGQLDRLSDLEAQKNALIAQMSAENWPVDKAQTAVLRRRAQENGQLYERHENCGVESAYLKEILCLVF